MGGEARRTRRLRADEPRDVEAAAQLLRDGGTVAFPTETVYGLGANALDGSAVAKIFAAKERPGWDPLIVHGSGVEMLRGVTRAETAVRDRMEVLAAAFWPGPLTLLLPKTDTVPDAVTAGRPRVGVRVPAHAVARRLIEVAGVPIAAPSANRFGRTSPTAAEHVFADLDGRIDAVLDGGATTVGVESTVLDVSEWPMVIYRPGAVTADMIRAVAGEVRLFGAAEVREGAAVEGLPSPGVGIRHYAPRARLVLVRELVSEARTSLIVAIGAEAGAAVGVMLPDGWDPGAANHVYRWGSWSDPDELARRMFDGLRTLDEAGVGVIVCPLPPGGGIGDAIRDRLEKAARAK